MRSALLALRELSALVALAACLIGPAAHAALVPGSALGFNTYLYVTQHYRDDKDDFFAHFPYDQYLDQVSFTDFLHLQYDRYIFFGRWGDGDPFLYRLAGRFTARFPLPESGHLEDAWRQRIQIAQAYLGAKGPRLHLSRGEDAIYQTIGYFLLGEVARSMEAAANHKRVRLDDPRVEPLVQQLRDHKVHLKIEETGWRKLVEHIRKGDFAYLSQRAVDYLRVYRWMVFVPCGLIGFISFRRPGWASKIAPVAFWGLAGIAGYYGIGRLQGKAGNALSKLSQQGYRNYAVAGVPGALQIHHLSMEGQKIGASVWMDRRVLRAGYMAQNVPQGFTRLRSARRLALVVAGGFTNSEQQPEGLTMQQGDIINAVLLPDRDGLVIVQNDGGIRVLNLKDTDLKLPLSQSTVETIQNPLLHIEAYAQLLDWSRRRKATLFQTQLLAYGDKLLIDRAKAKPEYRERHLLALVSTPADRYAVYHALFNVVTQCNLADLSGQVFGFLREHHYKVEALLNLDVGSFNILDVYDPSGAQLSSAIPVGGKAMDLLLGPRPPEQGTNLLYYSYSGR